MGALPLDPSKVIPGKPSVVVITRILTHDEIRLCNYWYDCNDPSMISRGSLQIISAYNMAYVDLDKYECEHVVGKLHHEFQIVTRIEYIAAEKAA